MTTQLYVIMVPYVWDTRESNIDIFLEKKISGMPLGHLEVFDPFFNFIF